MLRTLLLYCLTALAEIIGCYLPWLWLRQGGSMWLLLPAAASLALFVWLLTLHPAASGRVYAAYGGVYVATALLTESYRPAERAKVQALNDFLVFGTVALASFGSGRLLHTAGWDAITAGMLPLVAGVLLMLAVQAWRQRAATPTAV